MLVITKQVGARHRRKPLGRRKGFNIFDDAGFTKIRAFICAQILSKYFYYVLHEIPKVGRLHDVYL